ncbi:MAG: hypothetical protein Q7S80_02885 [bacterium]|nr:hypothetical protein [bacterium]
MMKKWTDWNRVALYLLGTVWGWYLCYLYSPTWKEDARKARAFESVMAVPESAGARKAVWNKKVYCVASTIAYDQNYSASAACFGLTGLGAEMVKKPEQADIVVSQTPAGAGATDIEFRDRTGKLLKSARVHSENEGDLAGIQFAFDLADATRKKK